MTMCAVLVFDFAILLLGFVLNTSKIRLHEKQKGDKAFFGLSEGKVGGIVLTSAIKIVPLPHKPNGKNPTGITIK